MASKSRGAFNTTSVQLLRVAWAAKPKLWACRSKGDSLYLCKRFAMDKVRKEGRYEAETPVKARLKGCVGHHKFLHTY